MGATIERLSSADLSFLRFETPATPWHIGALAILDGAVLLDPAGRLDLEMLTTRLNRRITSVPELRRRLYKPPFLGGRPVWVDDGTFDIRDHVREVSVGPPGGEAELLAVTARLLESLLDRRRPLWELWFLTGLDGGRVAVLLKLHHALADGMAAVAIVGTSLFEPAPDDPDPAPPDWTPQAVPGYPRLVADNVGGRLAALGHGVRALRHAPATIAAAWGMIVSSEKAPQSSINRVVRAGRRVRFTRLDLTTVKQRAHAAGGKVNDVVLAVVTAGLRELLLSRHERVDGVELLASVPVSLRAASQVHGVGNSSGAIKVPLPVGVPNPDEVLAAVVEATKRAKAREDPAFIIEFLSIVAATSIGRMKTMHQTWINVPVTDVPGPPVQLYMLGAPVLDVVPVVPTAGNCTVLVCAFSYAGRLYLVANVDATACPDVDVFMTGMESGWRRLSRVKSAEVA
jgi:diacylglycerol O-acyltransferase